MTASIKAMAREAHRQLVTLDYPGHQGQIDHWTMCLLTRFAALVRAQALEDAALAANEFLTRGRSPHGQSVAAAIRALKE